MIYFNHRKRRTDKSLILFWNPNSERKMHPVPIHHGTGLFLFHKRVLHGCKFDLHKCIQENFQLFFCLNLRTAELLRNCRKVSFFAMEEVWQEKNSCVIVFIRQQILERQLCLSVRHIARFPIVIIWFLKERSGAFGHKLILTFLGKYTMIRTEKKNVCSLGG